MEDMETQALRQLAQRKAKSGKGVIAMEALEDPDDDSTSSAEVVDLMEVLRRSLGAKAGPAEAPKSRRSTRAATAKDIARGSSRKAPAGKAAARKAQPRKAQPRNAAA